MRLSKIEPPKPRWLLSISGVNDSCRGIALQKTSGGLADSVLVLAGLSNGADFLTVGCNAEGVWWAVPGRSRGGSEEDEFFRKYSAVGGNRGVEINAQYTDDAVSIMVQALKALAVVSSRGDLEIGRQALARAVRATKGYAGATGGITFDKNGDRIRTGATIDPFVVLRGRFITP